MRKFTFAVTFINDAGEKLQGLKSVVSKYYWSITIAMVITLTIVGALLYREHLHRLDKSKYKYPGPGSAYQQGKDIL